MRKFYSVCRQPKWVCKYRNEKKFAFLSFTTSLVKILEKLPFHMAVQSYLYFRCHYINKFKQLNWKLHLSCSRSLCLIITIQSLWWCYFIFHVKTPKMSNCLLASHCGILKAAFWQRPEVHCQSGCPRTTWRRQSWHNFHIRQIWVQSNRWKCPWVSTDKPDLLTKSQERGSDYLFS